MSLIVVPDEHDRAAELLLGDDQQVAVVAPGETLAPVPAAVVPAGPVDQSRPVAGFVAGQRRVRPRCDQVLDCSGVMENPASSSRTSQASRAAASLLRRATPP
jgi:hypothetical protein